MKILFCGINYAPDIIGVPKYNTELCEWLQAQGHELRVVTAPPYYPAWAIPNEFKSLWYRYEKQSGIQITRAPIYVPRHPSGLTRLIHHASFALTSSWPIISSARSWRPDLMIAVAPSLMSCAFFAWAARHVGTHSWLHLQDFEIDAAFNLGLLSNQHLQNTMLAIERSILRSFDRVSTISPQMVRRLEQKGVGRHKIREVRNWANTTTIIPGNRITHFRRELDIKDTDIVALYSGNMASKQGTELIIDAAAELKATHPHIRFIIAGEGPQKQKLQEMAANLDNVRFLGLQPEDQFVALLNTADFHLLPQKSEAADLVLPSKLSGMLASGRPIIAMAAPETGLAAEVEGSGLVIPPGDTQALAAAAKRLAEDANLRSLLGVNARRYAEERWDKEAILQSMERELLALMTQRSKKK